MGHIQVHTPGGAQLWLSRRQAISQRQEGFLDHDGLEGWGGDECLSHWRRTSQRYAQAAQLVRRGRCRALDPGILRGPLLAWGTTTHGERRQTVEGKPSLVRPGVESHSRTGTKPHSEKTETRPQSLRLPYYRYGAGLCLRFDARGKTKSFRFGTRRQPQINCREISTSKNKGLKQPRMNTYEKSWGVPHPTCQRKADLPSYRHCPCEDAKRAESKGSRLFPLLAASRQLF